MASLDFSVVASNVGDTTATLNISILNETKLLESSVNVECTGGAGITTSCIDWSGGISKAEWPVTGLDAGTTYTCTGYNYEISDNLCADPSKAQYTSAYEFTTTGGPAPPTPSPASDGQLSGDTIGAIVVGIVAAIAIARLSY